MRERRYSAWPHVICGFFFVVLAMTMSLGALVSVLVALVAEQLMGLTSHGIRLVMSVTMFGTGLGMALLVFAGRWRQIENHASRYCSGFLAISLLYVPLVVVKYSLQLGIGKLRRSPRAE